MTGAGDERDKDKEKDNDPPPPTDWDNKRSEDPKKINTR